MGGSSSPSSSSSKSQDFSELPPEEKVELFLSMVKDGKGHIKAGDWMDDLVPHIKLHSIPSTALPHPKVVFSYTTQPQHCNRLQNLHGGCQATLFDFCTTMPLALVSRPGFWRLMGVSRTLNVTYMRPAPAGTEVLIECEVVAVGKSMATIKGVMTRKSDGAILSVCEHGKFNVDPPQEKL